MIYGAGWITKVIDSHCNPRPEWDKCAEHIPGGTDRWKEISEGKKSSELMEMVLHEIVGGGSSDASSSYFDGLVSYSCWSIFGASVFQCTAYLCEMNSPISSNELYTTTKHFVILRLT